MDIVDLRLIETNDGGDCVLLANDVQLISGFQNMPYICLFGGNVEQSTIGPHVIGQDSNDFWGNFLLHPTEQPLWFNSKTEKMLRDTALNSAGRQQIEEQVKNDLKFMNTFANVSVSVSLISVDKLRIYISLIEPNKKDSTELVYIWDATNAELTQ